MKDNEQLMISNQAIYIVTHGVKEKKKADEQGIGKQKNERFGESCSI